MTQGSPGTYSSGACLKCRSLVWGFGLLRREFVRADMLLATPSLCAELAITTTVMIGWWACRGPNPSSLPPKFHLPTLGPCVTVINKSVPCGTPHHHGARPRQRDRAESLLRFERSTYGVVMIGLEGMTCVMKRSADAWDFFRLFLKAC